MTGGRIRNEHGARIQPLTTYDGRNVYLCHINAEMIKFTTDELAARPMGIEARVTVTTGEQAREELARGGWVAIRPGAAGSIALTDEDDF